MITAHTDGLFITPPRNQGQIVTRSYAIGDDGETIVEECHDGSDGSRTLTAYAAPDAPFEPWNEVPKLGRRLGPCRIVQP
jgi:hypothetical protein